MPDIPAPMMITSKELVSSEWCSMVVIDQSVAVGPFSNDGRYGDFVL
jgi:hypothetical protein